VTASMTDPSRLLAGFPPVLPGNVLPDVTVVTFLRPVPQERLDGHACILCGGTDGLVIAGYSRQVPPVGGGKPVSAPIFSCQPCTRAIAAIARGRQR